MRAPSSPRFASLVLDADSTLASVEGVDWLAGLRGPVLAAESAALTAQAMAGVLPLEAVYETRLSRIRPTRRMLALLGEEYVRSVAPGAAACVAALQRMGVRVVMVSGGLRAALLPLAAHVGIAAADVHAVDLSFDAGGTCTGLDGAQPLARNFGKPQVVRSLGLPAPALAVGDGATDAAIRPEVAAFAAFTGFVRREAVVAAADHVVASFDELRALVLG